MDILDNNIDINNETLIINQNHDHDHHGIVIPNKKLKEQYQKFIREVIKIYFGKQIESSNGTLNKSINEWECKDCLNRNLVNNLDPPTPVKCNMKHGCERLFEHINNNHNPNWYLQLSNSRKNNNPYFTPITEKAMNIYGHIDNIISNNKTLSSVSDIKDRLYSRLAPISRATLMKYINALAQEVYLYIKNDLPPKFGLSIDGWKGSNGYFYIGMYATYINKKNTAVSYLIAICPFISEVSHSAASYAETIDRTLNWYGRTTDSILYLVSDNCSTMTKLSRDILKCPFIGCYAHKLNLAIKNWLGMLYSSTTSAAYRNRTPDQVDRERLVIIIHNICIKVRSMLNIAGIREISALQNEKFVTVLIDQETRWSSIYYMVKRFRQLYDRIKVLSDKLTDTSLSNLLPSPADWRKINDPHKLGDQLNTLNKVTKAVQSQGLTLDGVRGLFDLLIAKPAFGEYFKVHLSSDSSLIVDNNFDNAVIKILSKKESNLSVDEINAVKNFEITNTVVNIDIDDNENDIDEVDIVLNKAKKVRTESLSLYNIELLKNIPPTSVNVERLFSKAKLVMNDIRSRMTPQTFENRMILLENECIWKNVYSDPTKCKHLIDNRGYLMVQRIISKNEVDEVNDDNIDVNEHLSDDEY